MIHAILVRWQSWKLNITLGEMANKSKHEIKDRKKKEIKKERRDEIKEKKKLIPLIKKKGRRSINKLVAISLQLS